jgi:hypothetical protein
MSNPLGPWNAWFALSAQAARMCWEAQTVMFLRGLRMAQGGARAEAEVQRMITEKVAALAEAQVAATISKAARSTVSRRKHWAFTRGESAATSEGYRSSGEAHKSRRVFQ